MIVITIANEKGGVGKTTTATAIASALHMNGLRVLLVDTDPQRNSSDTMQAEVDGVATLFDVLCDDYPIEKAIQHCEFSDVLAGDPSLKKAPQILTGMTDFSKLKKALDKVSDSYDFVVIDTQPASNILTQNALVAARDLIVPIQASRYSLQGLSDFKKTIDEVREVNPQLRIAGLLVTSARKGTNINKEVLDLLPEVADTLGTKAFKTTIRQSVAIQEAQKKQVPIFSLGQSEVAKDYIDFIKEYLEGF